MEDVFSLKTFSWMTPVLRKSLLLSLALLQEVHLDQHPSQAPQTPQLLHLQTPPRALLPLVCSGLFYQCCVSSSLK